MEKLTNNKVPENTFFHIHLKTPEQVLSFANKLDSSKALDVDGLGPRIIKLAANILNPIAMLINQSITLENFPTHLKFAEVFPVFQGGTKSHPSNYRSISILPITSKIYENI